MDFTNFEYYVPIAAVIMWFAYQHHIFITPAQLEKKHREILSEVEKRFTTKEDSEHLKERIADMS